LTKLTYDDLERRYEGPIPPGELLLLQAGSTEAVLFARAKADVVGWRRLIREWIAEVIRPRRADRSIQPYQVETLRQYWAEYRRCVRRALTLQAIVDAGGKIDP